MPEMAVRTLDGPGTAVLAAAGCDPRLARLFAARGLARAEELATTLQSLVAPERLSHIDEPARLLADCIELGQRLLIVADYDADSATACAVGVKALRAMGANA